MCRGVDTPQTSPITADPRLGDKPSDAVRLAEVLQQQAATDEILRVISQSRTDVQPVFDMIADRAARICDAQFCHVFRYDGVLMHFAAHHGLSPEKLEAQRRFWPAIPDRGSAAGRAVLGARVEQIADIKADVEYKLGDLAELVNYRSLAAVPLLRDGVAIGAIAVARSQAALVPEQQIKLLQTFADQAVIAIENVRLFEEVQARTADLGVALEQQTATAEVLKVISRSTFDLQTVLDTLVESAARLCDADSATIAQQRGAQYYRTAVYGFSSQATEYLKDSPVEWDRGSGTGRTLIDATVVHIPDVYADPEYTWAAAKEVGRFRAMLGVPLLREGTPIGALVLTRERAAPFTDKQIDLVTAFADQAVIAIENVHLFDEVEARTAELQQSLDYQTATSDVLNIISRSAFDLQPVLKTLVETAGRLCQAENVQIWLREGDLYRLAAHNGFSPEYQEYARQHPITPSRGTLVARTALEVARIHIPDVLSDPEYTWFEGLKLAGFRAMLGVPLVREGSCIGVMAMTRGTPRPFTDKQIELVSVFADQAVIAIENVRLFEEVQARTRDLTESLEYQTATSEVLNVISRSPSELQPVLDTIVKTASRLCEAFDVLMVLRDGDSLRNAAHVGGIPVGFETWPINRGWASGRAVLDLEPIHVHDLTTPEMAKDFPDAHAMALRLGHPTILAVPLVQGNLAIGALTLRRTEVRPFSQKQIALLQTFADQAVIAINNVRLFEEVQASTEELSESLQQQIATADVLKAISRSAFDLQPVLETLVESATRLCDADHAWLFRREGEFFYWVAGFGHETEVHARLREYFRPLAVPVDRGSVTGRAALEARVVQITDVLADLDYAWSGAQTIGGYRAALGVPLLRNDEVVGVIFVGRTKPQPFAEKQIELVTTFADQAVIAIENARLFGEVQARTAELTESLEQQTATSEVLQVIGSSLTDTQPAFDAIVKSGSKLFPNAAISIALPDGDQVKAVAFAEVGSGASRGVAAPVS